LSIQAFQPVLIEGKAIQLHPLVCTGFNADFDGDQMAVHLPLGNAAILEAQLLMLASHNLLNPANVAPIQVPSQDMVLGLYYMTKPRKGSRGEGMTFYSAEEVTIAYEEKAIDLHAIIKVKVEDIDENGDYFNHIIETTVGRVLFNEFVPRQAGYVNQILTKKSLRSIITDVFNKSGNAITVKFLDDIKNLGYTMAYRGGLSFNLGDVIIPEDKAEIVGNGYQEVEEVINNYNMGFITNNERYNQVIDIWTHANAKLTNSVMKTISTDRQGFNSIYMMLDSGARGSKEQIRQLCGMRGLMAKPQKSGSTGSQIIENPILANFKEGLSVLEYFISTHGARKGLADTALKTADAGYLTRRLVDVAQDVIISEDDCGTLRGLVASDVKNNEEVVASLFERIVGRTTVHDIFHPLNGELIIKSGDEITEEIAKVIEDSPIETVEIRSVLTCESKVGVCAKCYGRNLATGKKVQKGEATGVIAAQSIGEPGTQLTLRTFHVGGIAGNISAQSTVESKYDGYCEIEELRSVSYKDDEGNDVEVVVSRLAELKIIDKNTKIPLSTHPLPYGCKLYVKNGQEIRKGAMICDWDPFNGVIITEFDGKVEFENLIEGITFREESDEQTGYSERVIIETKDKTKNPTLKIMDDAGEMIRSYNLPVGGHISVDNGQEVKAGKILVKIPRAAGKAGDITGGLPRVTELFEARNPSNPAVVSEVDGEVSLGKIKRGNREIIVTTKNGDVKRYLVPLSKQILVQENDYIRAGIPLSDGATTPSDILAIKGPTAVQEYILNEVQDVYRMQGVKINDKHFEIIIRQMMRKVEIVDPGDTRFLEKQIVDKNEFMSENDWIYNKKVVVEPGDAEGLKAGQIVSARRLRDENSQLRRKDKKLVESRDAIPATSSQILLDGLKENVICGHLIPAGTGLKEYKNLVVGSKSEYDRLVDMRHSDNS
jgi:DNA-directed RNA polymerase subunit beta'